jgi:hypothetical protein
VVEVLERMRSKFVSSRSDAGDQVRLKSIKGMITELARRRVLADLEVRADARVDGLAREVAKGRLTSTEAADRLLGKRKP